MTERTADDYERSIREKVYASNILTPGEWVYLVDLFQAKKDSEEEIKTLRGALQKVAEYGEAHIGYVNAMIDGKSVSTFARAASGIPKPR